MSLESTNVSMLTHWAHTKHYRRTERPVESTALPRFAICGLCLSLWNWRNSKRASCLPLQL